VKKNKKGGLDSRGSGVRTREDIPSKESIHIKKKTTKTSSRRGTAEREQFKRDLRNAKGQGPDYYVHRGRSSSKKARKEL